MKKIFFCLALTVIFAIGGMATSNPVFAQDSDVVYDVPIIMYHSTFKKVSSPHCITPNNLEKDLVYLKESGYTTIGINDLIAFQEDGKLLPDKPIILTFDDGYENNYKYAFPLLKKHNMKAVFSVVGRLIDENYDNSGNLKSKGAHVSYEQIKEMVDSGHVEIQNHTYDMHNLKGGRISMKQRKGESNQDYENYITKDLLKLEKNLKDNLGISCNAVTFPFGDYSHQTFDILKKLGFKAALTCNSGMNRISRDSDLFRLKRFTHPSTPAGAAYFAKYGL